MSVRTEATTAATTVDQTIAASMNSQLAIQQPQHVAPIIGETVAENHLAEANTFNVSLAFDTSHVCSLLSSCVPSQTTNPEHPLSRSVTVSIRASLNDLCLVTTATPRQHTRLLLTHVIVALQKKNKASWTPTGEAMKAILQQKKFADLNGTTEAQGVSKACSFVSVFLGTHVVSRCAGP